jgi:predicted aldo/keto reductase-like oxidoreductase
MTPENKMSRRKFIKIAGTVAAGSLIVPLESAANSPNKFTKMPTRPFGKTGVNVPILSFGGSLHLPMLMLRNAYLRGVTYWDTASSYMGGNSEKRIGKYFDKYPQDRKKIFLVTKSHAWSTAGMTDDLNRSLERMKTDYVDLYFVHSVRSIDDLNEEVKTWAEKTKAAEKIRFFGFSTHSNMEECMRHASKMGWIDGIMMSYNFRLMHTDSMRRAVDSCAEAGIGLTAMKTQGGGSVRTNTSTELELTERFLNQGFTDAQAKLKAVWENQAIASICSEMPNMTILMANVSAALNRTQISTRDMRLLHQYAIETSSDYCAGCAHICESAINGQIPISDIMRCLMYWRSYGDRVRAAKLFHDILQNRRHDLARCDYTRAELKCPQQMAIGNLMRTAINEFNRSDIV